MTVMTSIDPARLLEEQLGQASPDLLRELLTTFINTLMSAEADAVCGAEYGAVSADRVNRRNGYRAREFDTRAGTLDLAVPKLRQGSYFPEWLLERRKRAERALTSVVATCYLLGVSTRRMDKLVQSLGITSLSKSQVSEIAADLDAHVEQFRTRRLDDAGPFTFVAADALVLKVREGGRDVPIRPVPVRLAGRARPHGPDRRDAPARPVGGLGGRTVHAREHQARVRLGESVREMRERACSGARSRGRGRNTRHARTTGSRGGVEIGWGAPT